MRNSWEVFEFPGPWIVVGESRIARHRVVPLIAQRRRKSGAGSRLCGVRECYGHWRASYLPRSLRMFRIAVTTSLLAAALLAGCSTTHKTPAVTDIILGSLAEAGLKNVSVKQDRDKGVVTLGGQVATEDDKAKAGQIAHAFAGEQVVANEVAILPATDSGPAKTANADLDEGIGKNLDAALISSGYKSGIGHSVRNEVVTLTGTVDTERQRKQLETIAQGVPNTQQVVNEIQTRHQKATSAN